MTIKNTPGLLRYLLVTLATFLVLQGMVVVIHEFTHSTTAWLLGIMDNPLDILWGNPITMTGWDENVSYRRLFADGYTIRPALTGIAPIIMHSTAVIIALLLMRGQWLAECKWVFHAVYWYTVVNLMELIAYIYMRAFSGHGDIGNFDHGMNISPWWAFVIGSILLSWALWRFFRDAMPRLQRLFMPDSLPGQWLIVALTSFLLFLWGSGLRVMVYVDSPQWMFGLAGIVLFVLSVVCFRPGKA